MNTLMVAAFIGMTILALVYWYRANYYRSRVALAEMMLTALALKNIQLEAQVSGKETPKDGVIKIDLTDFLPKDD